MNPNQHIPCFMNSNQNIQKAAEALQVSTQPRFNPYDNVFALGNIFTDGPRPIGGSILGPRRPMVERASFMGRGRPATRFSFADSERKMDSVAANIDDQR